MAPEYVVLATVHDPAKAAPEAMLYSLGEPAVKWVHAGRLEQDCRYEKAGGGDAEEYQQGMAMECGERDTLRLILEQSSEALSDYRVMTVRAGNSVRVAPDFVVTVDGKPVGRIVNTRFRALWRAEDVDRLEAVIDGQLSTGELHLLLDESRAFVLRVLPELRLRTQGNGQTTPAIVSDRTEPRNPPRSAPRVPDHRLTEGSDSGSKKAPPGMTRPSGPGQPRDRSAARTPDIRENPAVRPGRSVAGTAGQAGNSLDEHVSRLVMQAVAPLLRQQTDQIAQEQRQILNEIDRHLTRSKSLEELAQHQADRIRQLEVLLAAANARIGQIESDMSASMLRSRNKLREDLGEAIVTLTGYDSGDRLAEHALSVLEALRRNPAEVPDDQIEGCRADIKRMEDDLLRIRREFVACELIAPGRGDVDD